MFTKIDGYLSEKYTCSVCERKTSRYNYKYTQSDNEHFIMSCKHCGQMFAKPVFIDQLADRKMDNIASGEMRNSSLLASLYGKFILEKEINIIKKISNSFDSPKLLDVACGTGWTTSIYQNNGFDVTGVEPSRARATRAREKYGLEIHNCYLEELPIEGQYDVVILRHIIEHFEYPKEMLQKTLKLLKDGGVIVIVAPNINCLGRYLFQTKWDWIIPLHFNFFNMKSLVYLVESCSLSVKKKYQTPSPLWFPKSFINSLPVSDSLKKNFLKTKMLKYVVIIPFVLLGMILNLNDNLTVIAQK